MNTPSTTPQSKPPTALIVTLAVIGFGAWFVLGRPGLNDVARMEPAATVAAAGETPAYAWMPDGFTVSVEPTVAYRWIDRPDCQIADQCWGIEAVARDGCPDTLYIELSILDSSGAAVDYTNDTVGALSPGQHAKLTFENLSSSGHQARISKVTCI